MSQKWRRPMVTGAAAALVAVAASTVVTGQVALPSAQPEPRTDKPKPALKVKVREPAVAGLFYPKEEAALSKMLGEFLDAAPANSIVNLKALIFPHAGYQYSGLIAASAYRLLLGREFQTVIVLAPSHYALFEGAAVCAADVYRTPLGTVAISEKAKELGKLGPFVMEPSCRVQRPPWAAQSSRPMPAAGEDQPDTWEHSDEVQVPFLQKVLKNFQILPIILGDVDPAEAARILADRVDDKTLLVASSDLSHYHAYGEAKELDQRCLKAICSLDVEQMKSQEAGKLPILTLMHVARKKGWKAQSLGYRNSGDVTGDHRGVVGYTAVAFYEPGQENFTAPERKHLLELAQRTIKEVVAKGSLPEVDAAGLPNKFAEPKGCFVTLTKKGVLRGCIGHIFAKAPLYRAVMDNAQSAAMRDPRFPPVQPEELDKLEIEISVLTEPQQLHFNSPEELLSQLQPYRDGVLLRIGANGATYLPQVWAQIPDKVSFLDKLCQKAGCETSAWKNPETAVYTYRVESFKESEP